MLATIDHLSPKVAFRNRIVLKRLNRVIAYCESSNHLLGKRRADNLKC
jgi:hypothetical protein